MHHPAIYRRRPVRIEAMRLTPDDAERVAAWCGGRLERDGAVLWLQLGTSRIPARLGDWIAREVAPASVEPYGWYPIKSEFFDWAYEPVT